MFRVGSHLAAKVTASTAELVCTRHIWKRQQAGIHSRHLPIIYSVDDVPADLRFSDYDLNMTEKPIGIVVREELPDLWKVLRLEPEVADALVRALPRKWNAEISALYHQLIDRLLPSAIADIEATMGVHVLDVKIEDVDDYYRIASQFGARFEDGQVVPVLRDIACSTPQRRFHHRRQTEELNGPSSDGPRLPQRTFSTDPSGPIHARRPFMVSWTHRPIYSRGGAVQHLGVAEIEGEVIGRIYLNESPYLERALMVSSSQILPAWQGQGAGLSLYLAALDHAREMNRPFLHADWKVEVAAAAAWIWRRLPMYCTPQGRPVGQCPAAAYVRVALLSDEYDVLPDELESESKEWAEVAWRRVRVRPEDWKQCPATPHSTINPLIEERAFVAGVGDAPLTIAWS